MLKLCFIYYKNFKELFIQYVLLLQKDAAEPLTPWTSRSFLFAFFLYKKNNKLIVGVCIILSLDANIWNFTTIKYWLQISVTSFLDY